MSGDKTTVSAPVEKDVAEEFTRKCEEAGLAKTEAIRQFITEFSVSGEKEELELREEQLRADIDELQSEKERVDQKLSAKKSQLELVRDKKAELEADEAEFEELVSELAEKKASGLTIVTLPQFEEAIEVGDVSAKELEEIVEEQAEEVESEDEGDVDLDTLLSGDSAGDPE